MKSAPPTDLPPIREEEPMARHCSWRAGGVARYYSESHNTTQALALATWAAERNLPLRWIGRGTNLLVRDVGYPGLLVNHRAQAWRLEDRGDSALLHVEAGATMAGLARRITHMGWAGLVWAEGLPGGVGGAVVGNAGCYGGDIATSLICADLLLAGQVVTWPVERFGFGYRMSVLKEEAESIAAKERKEMQSTVIPSPLVLTATFRLQRGDAAALKMQMSEIAIQRKLKTPAGSSCGSVFKNPAGDSAGRLIEAAGLKGHTLGGAMVSPLHANYIINRGEACGEEIEALIALIQSEVARQFGVMLELEVSIIP